MCINAREDNLPTVMPARIKLRSRRKVLALHSHSHVTGSVQANCNKTYKFEKSILSHSLRARAQVVALSLVALLMCLCFHLETYFVHQNGVKCCFLHFSNNALLDYPLPYDVNDYVLGLGRKVCCIP